MTIVTQPGLRGTAGRLELAHLSRGASRARHLSPQRLSALASSAAELVRADLADGEAMLSRRQCELLDRTSQYELWLIHWPTEAGLSLHDHGGSSGAFHLVRGTLEETSWAPRGTRLHRRLLRQGSTRSFGPEYVHSVVNPAPAPASSVHAYSPPLSSMRFYRESSAGLVVSRVETEWEGAP